MSNSMTTTNNNNIGWSDNNNNNNNNDTITSSGNNGIITNTTTTTINEEDSSLAELLSSSYSLIDRLNKVIQFIETSSSSSSSIPINNNNIIQELNTIQEQIAYQSIYSKNEDINELSNEALRLLVVEYYLGIAYMNIPFHIQEEPNAFYIRQQNLIHTCNLFIQFLHRLELLSNNNNNNNTSTSTTLTSAGNNNNDNNSTKDEDKTSFSTTTILLSNDEIKQYHELVDVMDNMTKLLLSSSSSSNNNNPMSSMQSIMNTIPPVQRDIKIARHNAKEQASKEYNKLQQLYERRKRLNILHNNNDEIIDGYDSDSLIRAMAITNIIVCKYNTFDEFINILRELPMISIQVQRQKDYTTTQNRYNSTSNGRSSNSQQSQLQSQSRPPPSSKPLEVTHITQNPISGQLHIQKEVIQSTIFRPGWNQPTMSLEELAYREVEDAKRREEQQKIAEENQLLQPRRYKELVKAEQEDDTDLVDASAVLDRKWDDWKDENPRGSGNKRGDVGDRNF